MFGSLRKNVNLYIAMMAETNFLTILLTVTCFLGGVVSVTDKEFEVCIEPILNIIFNECMSKIKPFNGNRILIVNITFSTCHAVWTDLPKCSKTNFWSIRS